MLLTDLASRAPLQRSWKLHSSISLLSVGGELVSLNKILQREVADALLRKFEARPQLQGGLEGVCRLLLIADSYHVPLLRDHCLQRLAARYT